MSKIILFENKAKEDLEYWKKTNNKRIVNRIKELLKDIQEHPFIGPGKPEPLKENLSGYWSRRIDREHRLVHTITDNEIIVVLCMFYY